MTRKCCTSNSSRCKVCSSIAIAALQIAPFQDVSPRARCTQERRCAAMLEHEMTLLPCRLAAELGSWGSTPPRRRLIAGSFVAETTPRADWEKWLCCRAMFKSCKHVEEAGLMVSFLGGCFSLHQTRPHPVLPFEVLLLLCQVCIQQLSFAPSLSACSQFSCSCKHCAAADLMVRLIAAHGVAAER